MRFLLRAAFWLGVVLLLLPDGGSKPEAEGNKAQALGAAEAASAASATLTDMRQFCTRQPEACAVGAQVAVAAGQKAQAGAKRLYEFLSETLAAKGADAAANASPADPRTAAAADRGSRDTLTARDAAPEWRGPARAKDAAPRRALGES